MSWEPDFTTTRAIRRENTATFASQVYSWLAAGLGLTGALTYLIYRMNWFIPLAPFWPVWALGLFGIAFTMTRRSNALSFGQLAALFLVYAGLEGLFFGTVIPAFIASSGVETVWMAFASAAVASLTAVLYGNLTRADLTALRGLFSLGIIGLLATTLLCVVLSFFMKVGGLQLVIAYVGLALFLGLAAADAQQIQRVSRQLQLEGDSAPKLSLLVALNMYANVIMVFWYLLQIFSSNRDD